MISSTQRARLVHALPARYTTALPHLARVRLLTGAHLDALLADAEATPEATSRIRRRIMNRLIDLGLVTTLHRTIGGARAGSAGHVYTLTPAGHRALAAMKGQPCPPRTRSATLGTLFVDHALAISGIYVQLITTSRDHDDVQVTMFAIEPVCWQATGGGGYLKPDAYLRLATATHADCWWLEIDQNTESLPRITRKCRDYLDYLTHAGVGPDRVPPRVLFTVPDIGRRNAIDKAITTLSASSDQMINVVTHTDAAAWLITELHTP